MNISRASSRSLSSEQRAAKARRTVRACLQCRSRKQRCLPASPAASPQTPCQRCAGHGATCSFETEVTQPGDADLSPSRLAQVVVDLHQKMHLHEIRIMQLEAELASLRHQPQKEVEGTPQQHSRVYEQRSQQRLSRDYPSEERQRIERHRRDLVSVPRNDIFSMDSLELEDPIATLRSLGALSPESMNARSQTGQEMTKLTSFVPYDPIDNGAITVHECERAIGIYFESCHPWAPVLSEDLREQGRQLRSSSPLLFLAIVCIGARFWNSNPSTPWVLPGFHPRYFDLVTLFDTAISRLLIRPVPSDATIDSVCALLLYAQWMPYFREDSSDESHTGGVSQHDFKSRYNDLSAWAVFGLAVRYATFLGLDKKALSPFRGITETTANRGDLSRARVWLNLVTYDCNLTLTSGLPTSVDPALAERTARSFCAHRLAQYPGDLRYAALVELASIVRRAKQGERGRHPNVDALRKANMEFEDWERHWLPKLCHTMMQHNQLPFTSIRWYRLALNSSMLRPLLSFKRIGDEQQPMQVWLLSALETSLTAASQILFSQSTSAASEVWNIASQNPASFPEGPFSLDPVSLLSLHHAVDSTWISHAFALTFIVLCYIRGTIDDDLRISILTSPHSKTNNSPSRPRQNSILARLAKLALEIFGYNSDACAFRPIDKISPLVFNAASLVLPLGEKEAHVAEDSFDPALEDLFNLIDDSGLDWPSTLFDEEQSFPGSWEV